MADHICSSVRISAAWVAVNGQLRKPTVAVRRAALDASLSTALFGFFSLLCFVTYYEGELSGEHLQELPGIQIGLRIPVEMVRNDMAGHFGKCDRLRIRIQHETAITWGHAPNCRMSQPVDLRIDYGIRMTVELWPGPTRCSEYGRARADNSHSADAGDCWRMGQSAHGLKSIKTCSYLRCANNRPIVIRRVS